MKKVLIIIFCALLVGGSLACFLFKKIVLEDEKKLGSDVVTAFQVGVFSNYDNAVRVAERNNGIVVSDSDLYRVYVAILYDEVAIGKMIEYYDGIGLNYYLKKINVSSDFIDSISSNEELLIKSSSDTYSVINLSVLEQYEELL